VITQLTDNVFVQETGTSSPAGLPVVAPGDPLAGREIRLGHAVNFYSAGGCLPVVQQMSANSMVRGAGNHADAALRSVLETRDRDLSLEGFLQAHPLLDKTVCDVRKFKVRRQLPLLFDILDASPSFKEYTDHNAAQAKAVLDVLTGDPSNKKKLAAFCAAHGEIYPDGRPIRF
jgi:hypothetical protein